MATRRGTARGRYLRYELIEAGRFSTTGELVRGERATYGLIKAFRYMSDDATTADRFDANYRASVQRINA